MLMRLDLALITEAAGLAEEDREEAKPLVMIYMPKMYNNQPLSVIMPVNFATSKKLCWL